jgi:hypothetical protein
MTACSCVSTIRESRGVGRARGGVVALELPVVSSGLERAGGDEWAVCRAVEAVAISYQQNSRQPPVIPSERSESRDLA